MTTTQPAATDWGWGPNPHADLIAAVDRFVADGRITITVDELYDAVPEPARRRFADGLDVLVDCGRIAPTGTGEEYDIVPTAAATAQAYGHFGAVRDAVDTIRDRGHGLVDVDTVLNICHATRPGLTRCGALTWLRFLAAEGRIVATPYATAFTFPDEDPDTTEAVPAPADDTPIPHQAAAPAAAPEHGDQPPVPAPAADTVLPELHRRTADAVGNIRAADNKASVLLAVLGFSAGPLGTIDYPAALAAVGAVLVLPAVLLGLVLLPRTGGRVDRTDWPVPALIADITDRGDRYALAAELRVLDAIADRKYTLIRRALFAMTGVIPAYVAAYLTAGL